MREIPGWKEINEADIVDMVYDDYCSNIQIVTGRKYAPDVGKDSLKLLVNEWLDAVEGVWEGGSCVLDGKRVAFTSRAGTLNGSCGNGVG